jgi:hypothetical protein
MDEDPYLSQFKFEKSKIFKFVPLEMLRKKSVAEPHNFYAVPAPALSPALLNSKEKFQRN